MTCGPCVSISILMIVPGPNGVLGDLLPARSSACTTMVRTSIAEEELGIVQIDARSQRPLAIGEGVGAIQRNGNGFAQEHIALWERLAEIRIGWIGDLSRQVNDRVCFGLTLEGRSGDVGDQVAGGFRLGDHAAVAARSDGPMPPLGPRPNCTGGATVSTVICSGCAARTESGVNRIGGCRRFDDLQRGR